MTREEIDLVLTGKNREAVLAHADIVSLQHKKSFCNSPIFSIIENLN